MKAKIILIAFTVLPFFFYSQTNDNKMEKNGKEFINLTFAEKKYEKSYLLLDSIVTSNFKISDMENLVSQLQEQYGNFKQILEINSQTNLIYYYYCEFEKSKLDLMVNFNENSLITGFYFVPHKDFKKNN